MTYVESVLLGIVQALTEFLPVSSSGHLRIGREIFGSDIEAGILFDVLVHGGTLLAVFYVYSDRIGSLLREGLTALREGPSAVMGSDAGRLLILLVIATRPTGVMGVLASDWIASDFFTISVVGGLLLVNGVILITSRRFGTEPHEAAPDERRGLEYAGITWATALLIGVAQGFAILPGISRAGITIVTALALGADRERAAEFSFFLSIPAILGAIVLESLGAPGELASGNLKVYAVGAIVAAFVGVVALKSLLELLRRAQMHRFAWYCWALGLFAIVYELTNVSG